MAIWVLGPNVDEIRELEKKVPWLESQYILLNAKVFRPAGLKEKELTGGSFPLFYFLLAKFLMAAKPPKYIYFDARSLKRTAEVKYVQTYGLSAFTSMHVR